MRFSHSLVSERKEKDEAERDCRCPGIGPVVSLFAILPMYPIIKIIEPVFP